MTNWSAVRFEKGFVILGLQKTAYISDVTPHPEKEGLNVVNRGGVHNLPVVKDQTNPQVIHEDRKQCHHGRNTNGASKLVAKRGSKSVRGVYTMSWRTSNLHCMLVQLFVHKLAFV